MKKSAKSVILEDSSIEGFGSSPDCLPATDKIVDFVHHLIPHFLFEVRVGNSMIEPNAGNQLGRIRGSLPPTRCLRHQ